MEDRVSRVWCLKGYWGSSQSNSKVQNMVMILKKTKLLRKNRPRTCELQVSDGRSTGTRTHHVTCEASLPGMDAHPLSLHGDISPHLCQLNHP